MNKITICLPKHRWVDSEVSKQLGSQYVEGSPLSSVILRSTYILTKSVDQVGNLTGVHRATVWNRLKKLGQNTRLGGRDAWTESEEALLRKLYHQVVHGRVDAKCVAKALNRSLHAVHSRAYALGITKERPTVSINPPRDRQLKFNWPWFWHPHPKGMLGKKHSQETKHKISEFHSGKVIPRDRVERSMKTKLEKYGSLGPNNIHGSWKSSWREIGGKRCFFRSAWEANYARYLEFLKTNGNISEWEHEPHTFWFSGIKRGCVSYLPDFRITNPSGSQEFHEVKGWMDPRSVTKIARMAKYFPEVKLIIIDSKWFKRNRPQLKGLISGWENVKC